MCVVIFNSKQVSPIPRQLSKMTSKLNPAAPDFVPSVEARFQFVGKMNSKKAPKYRSKQGELWQPPKGWLASYRCAACRVIMTRKEASKCPQRINACDHITCAKCIVSSYLVELNPLCPVAGCGKCVNPKRKEPVAPVTILTGPTEIVTPPPTPTDEVEGCGFCGSTHLCGCNEEICFTPVKKNIHYCGDDECEWDCGVLWCGCIDQCRGRCGLNDHLFNRW
jgi:hypothetical protein